MGRRTIHRTLGVRAVALTATAALLSGCGWVFERATEQVFERATDAAGVEIDSETGEVRIETDEGEVTLGESSEVPSSVTDVIDLPSDFQPMGVTDYRGEEGTGAMVIGVVRGDPDALADQLEAAVEAGGWDEVSSTQLGPQAKNWAGSTGDRGVQVQLLINEDGDEHQLHVIALTPNG